MKTTTTRIPLPRVLRPLLIVVAILAAGCMSSSASTGSSESQPAASSGTSDHAEPSSWRDVSDEEWRERLSPEAYRVLRQHGTERAGTSPLLRNSAQGVYTCGGCGAELFASDTKYDSRTGWPSFHSPIDGAPVGEEIDRSAGMTRIEVHCSRCGGHLGHVFPDGPEPTGLRYCINGVALGFEERDAIPESSVPEDSMTSR